MSPADVMTCYKHHHSDEVLSDGMRIRLLTAQRDMYISGFCLFLFLYVPLASAFSSRARSCLTCRVVSVCRYEGCCAWCTFRWRRTCGWTRA